MKGYSFKKKSFMHAGCPHFMTVRRYNAFMSGAQDSLLYSRVETVLASEIADGDLRVGDQLPTEDSLISRFGVSRINRSSGYSESCEPRPCRDSSRQRHIRCCPEDHPGAYRTERICGGYARSWPQADGPRDQ